MSFAPQLRPEIATRFGVSKKKAVLALTVSDRPRWVAERRILHNHAATMAGAIMHFDGTARVQTVSKSAKKK